jgi:uncharacterized protein YfbU (UPF0304 family)
MKVETFIKNETKKYRKKVITAIKKHDVNLDKLEKMFKQHEENCKEFIDKQNLFYSEKCKYNDIAEKELQKIDDEFFGVFNDIGICIGYDFCKYNRRY